MRRVHLFTTLQLSLLGGCWAINLSPLGLCAALFVRTRSLTRSLTRARARARARARTRCVAFLIVALVPLRIIYLPRIFTDAELLALDSD